MTVSKDSKQSLLEALEAGPQPGRDDLCKFGKMVYDDKEKGGNLQDAVTKLAGFGYLWSARELASVIKQCADDPRGIISYSLINDHRKNVCRCPAGWNGAA